MDSYDVYSEVSRDPAKELLRGAESLIRRLERVVGSEWPTEIRESQRPYDEKGSGEEPVTFQFIDQVTILVCRSLVQLEGVYGQQGRSLQELGSAAEVAERMLATVPTPSPWGEVLGPFYGPGKVQKVLGGVSRQAVADRRRRGTLLGLKTADGAWVYPQFQFDERHQVLPGLSEILKIFRHCEIDEWTLAGWLVGAQDSLGGKSVIECLRLAENLDTLRQVAAAAAQRFAQ